MNHGAYRGGEEFVRALRAKIGPVDTRHRSVAHTPSELDFCPCGGTFQIFTGHRERRCGLCGRFEGQRRSWHERTGVPYSRGQAAHIPMDVEMDGRKVVEGRGTLAGEGDEPQRDQHSPGGKRGVPAQADRLAVLAADLPSTAHRKETVEAKTARLVAEGKVTVLHAEAFDNWSAVVDGDHGAYVVTRTPDLTICECIQNKRPHSHTMAAQTVAERMLG